MVSNGLDGLDKGLSGAAQRFIDVLTPVVEEVAGEVLNRKSSLLRDDVTVEAYNIAVAFIDADGRHTDPELRALVVAFGGRLPTQLSMATPNKIRDAGILRGKRAWLDEPSVLFDILVKADARLGTEHAKTYYERAMLIAHTVASLDDITSQAELNAIDHFRSLLLGRIDNRPRPAAVAGAGGAKDGAANSADGDKPGPPKEEDLPPKRSVEDLLAELDTLVGLDAVKAEVRLVADMLAVQRLRIERGIEVADTSRHLVFTGNPGTGKTTVARLLAEIYRSLEVVELGHLVETDRSGLVAGFVGQTAQRVVEVFDRADQGVLLIDEAYSLVRGGEKDFGREAIDTIVKLVEDRRDRVVCIAAGYPDEMADFIGANPGLKSRFPKTVHFPDYETDELVEIFELIANGNTYELDDDGRTAIRQWLDDQPRTKGFGNGRLARNLFEAMVAEQAGRVVAIDNPTDEDLVTLTADDLPPINALDPTATSSVAEVEAEVAAASDTAEPETPRAPEPTEPEPTAPETDAPDGPHPDGADPSPDDS